MTPAMSSAGRRPHLERRAFLYSSKTGMVDLNSLLPADSGWVLTTANAINNKGQIVGQGFSAKGTDALLLNLSEVVPTSLAWDGSNGGVDYSYEIGGGDLPEPTTIELDWASGTTVNTIIGDPIVSTTTATAPGTYDLHATLAQLGAPPPDAFDLLVVTDPDDIISPADPNKVEFLPLTRIAVSSPTFHTSDGGVDFGYSIGGAGLPQAAVLGVYWATGATFDTVIGDPAYTTTTETSEGTYDVHVTPKQLGKIPLGAKDLLVIADAPDPRTPMVRFS